MTVTSEIIGYHHRGCAMTGEEVIRAMIRDGIASPGALTMAVENVLDQCAGAMAIDRDNMTAEDAAEFPAPITMDGRYAVDGYRGVAFRLIGWAQKWEPETVLTEWCGWCYEPVDYQQGTGTPFCTCEDTADYGRSIHESWEETGDGEWIPDPSGGIVRAVMVGDDRVHEVAISDLIPLADEDYCSGCGQMGCGWGSH